MTALAAPPFEAIHPGFADVTGAAPRLVRVVATDAHEGPVYREEEDARGLALNSPNDVVVRCDGTLWFTDPSYSHYVHRPHHIVAFDVLGGRHRDLAAVLEP